MVAAKCSKTLIVSSEIVSIDIINYTPTRNNKIHFYCSLRITTGNTHFTITTTKLQVDLRRKSALVI